MGKNRRESGNFESFNHSSEGEKFFHKIAVELGIQEDTEHMILPFVDRDGKEVSLVKVLKFKKISDGEGNHRDLRPYLQQIIEDKKKSGLLLKSEYDGINHGREQAMDINEL